MIETAFRATYSVVITPPLEEHDEQIVAEAGAAELVCQRLEVPPNARLDVGVDQRGAGALELGRGGHHLVGERDVGLGVLFKDELTGAQLVRRVDIREKEGDGDGLGSFELELPRRGAHRLLVERPEHGALGVEAFGDVDAPPPRGDGDRGRVGRVPDALFPTRVRNSI